jgi:glycosyltransferase involved in cell wall biosynthesis
MIKKKIAFIGAKGIPAIGGAARVCESIINYLKMDYEIVVYATATHADRSWKADGFQQIVIPKFPIKKLNIYFYYLCAYLHTIFLAKYDIIHIHLIDSGIFMPLLRLKYTNVLGTSHGRGQLVTDKFGKLEQSFLKLSEKLFLTYSTRITVVCKPLVEDYKKLTSKNVNFIPNGIDIDNTIDLKNNSIELSKNKLIDKEYLLFSAGRIIPLKGCHLFLKALYEKKISVPAVVIGDIDQILSYKTEIQDLMGKVNAKYLGFIKDKTRLLHIAAGAKLYIFPSTYENMSMMLLEVASVKTPIICSDIPENIAIFNNNEVLFFRNNDYHDLAEKIVLALNGYDEMTKKANLAYEKLIKNYTWNKIAKQYVEEYNCLINNLK